MEHFPFILNNRFARGLLALLALIAAFGLGIWSVDALGESQPSAVSFGTGFTYQGFLRDSGGTPITDTCDLTFRLYDAATLGNQVGSADVVAGVVVADGLFTAVVNDADEFGPAGVNGAARYLEIDVQCTGDASPTTLTERQPLTPVPYARFAERFAGYENLIVVAKEGGDFASVGAAVDAIGVDPVYPAASASNRYLIYVAPGVYENESIQMKGFVDIEGSGRGVTVLTANGGDDGIKPESATLVGAANAELRHVTVENVSAAPANWAFAIYTEANTSFTHVTALASGGSHPRGMMVYNGGMPALRDVALIAQDGTITNNGLDVFQASVLADGLFANASGGQYAHGLYINTVSQPAKMENVTTFASNGTTQTNGMYIAGSQVNLVGYDTVVSSGGSLVTGIYCTGANQIGRLDAREIAVQGTKDSDTGTIRGLSVSNCHLNLHDAEVDVSSPGRVFGLYYSGSDTLAREIELNQVDIRANSSADRVSGLYLTSSSDTSTSGRIGDVTIQASGNLTTGSSYGVYHRSDGLVQYQDLAIDITGQANFMYGVQAANGTPYFQDLIVAAYGDAETTVVGVEYINPVSGGSVDDAQILAQNNVNDAVGLKSNAPQSFSFNNIVTKVYAPSGVWGYDFVSNSIVSATDLETLAEGNADGTTVRGIRCQGGSADIHNARLTAQTNPSAISSLEVYGMHVSNCELTLSGSQVRVLGTAGLRLGLYATAPSGAPPYFVRDSYLRGVSGALQTAGYAELVVVESQLDGGVTTTVGTNATSICTAVSHGTGTSFSFTPGPVVPCP